MATEIRHTCDGKLESGVACLSVKEPEQYWCSVMIKPGVVQIYRSQSVMQAEGFQHYCSNECLLRRVDEVLTERLDLEKTA